MFWKTNPTSRWSIANKLTIFYTALTSCLLLVVLSLFYFLLLTFIKTAEKQYLIDEIYIMREILQDNNHLIQSVQQEVSGVPKALKDAKYHYFVNIYDMNNKLLTQTKSLDDPKLTGYPALDSHNWESNIKSYTQNSKTYMLITGPIDYDQNHHVIKYAQIALEISFQDALLKQYALYAIFSYFLTTIGIYFLARVITHKGLKQLYKISDVTNQINFPKLKTSNLNLADWPKELVPIGQAYNNMIKRIEDSFVSLSQNIDILAHELRTPINNLTLEAEYTLAKSRDLEDYEKTLRSNLEEYQRLSSIIDSILFLARHDNDYISLETETMDIYEVIKEICDFCQLAATEKNIHLQIYGKASLVANKVLFQRVIYNLLDNAIKYTQSDGNVIIKIDEDQDNTHIIISDTGIGISQQFQEDVFKRFFRIKNTFLHESGVGLGLAIVKSIMNLHRGNINLVSQLNEGTSIYFSFPK